MSYFQLLIILVVFIGCKSEKPHTKKEIPVSHYKTTASAKVDPLLFIFFPGLDPASAKSILNKRIKYFNETLSTPQNQFATLLTGSKPKEIYGLRFYKKGKKMWADSLPIAPPSWLTNLSGDETFIFAPSKHLFLKHSRRFTNFSPPKRVLTNREEIIKHGEQYILFIPSSASKPGVKWKLNTTIANNSVIITLPEGSELIEKGGQTVFREQITLKTGEAKSLILTSGAKQYYLYLQLFMLTDTYASFYRRGPIVGSIAPFPDFSGVKKEFISEEMYGTMLIHSLRTIEAMTLKQRKPFNILRIDNFAWLGLLLSSLDTNETYIQYKNLLIQEIKSFLTIIKNQNKDINIVITGISPMIPLEKRLDVSKLLMDEDLIFLSSGSELFIYSIFPSKLREKRGIIIKKLKKQISPYQIKIDVFKEAIRLRLPGGTEAGKCPKQKILCESRVKGGHWGYSDPATGWYSSTTNNFCQDCNNPVEFSLELFKKFIKR